MSSKTYTSGAFGRRDLITAGLFAIPIAGCRRARGTGYAGYAIVATAGQRSVAAVDLTAFRLAKTIALPGEPSAVVSGPHVSYVLSPHAGTISVIDKDLNVPKARRLADQISHVRLTADGKHMLAVSPSNREILLLLADGLQTIGRRRLRSEPKDVDLFGAGPFVAVAGSGGTVDLLNFATGEWRQRQLSGDLGSIRFRGDGKLLLAAQPSESIVTVLTVPDLKTVTELPLGMRPDNLCFTPDGGQLFVTGAGMDAVAIVFPYDTVQVEQTVLAGRDPGVMACSDTYLFVASASGSDMTVLRIETRKVVGAVQVGQVPRFVTLTPDTQYVLTLNESSGDMAVVRIGAIRAIREKTGVGLFTLLPVGERPVHCGFLARA